MVDYIADYLDTVASRRVFPDVRPGFLHAMLPESAPLDGEPWDQIMADVDRVIMPGVRTSNENLIIAMRRLTSVPILHIFEVCILI